ncbi:dihydrofolate reductase [Fodinibius halophilus]|uniref:Dihydrofolate reductase n=1 Tax=Fodinibius halophilus TaxID=1736908 RepID=A0A6M1STL1_9BACT|nr:dihydrofolate reductase [Fodinibius halophilus]NGP86886.1 dihydrofolate reductase [Fodinibius halophilus]
MTLAAIVAHDPNLVIGKDGDLPWHYSEDLQYFKRITMGHPMIMGRVVFEELDEKPLPGRENIVLSRSKDYEHVPTFSSIDEAMEYVKNQEIVFVIGGGKVYRQFMDGIDKLFVTEIKESFEGDTYFPEYRDEIGTTWKEVKREDKQELAFVVYERME